MNAAMQISPPASRFVDNGDGTVTDPAARLMWSKATLCDEEINQHDAVKLCAELDLAGHTDWRIPTVEELFALADRSRSRPAIDTDAFPDTHGDWYWSGTEYAADSSYAWLVGFSNGYSFLYPLDSGLAVVRAVRS